MKLSSLQFQITKLQQAKLNTTVETIAVIVLALFISAILPSLLVRYFYANQQLFEQPKLLEYIPIVAFAIGTGYAVYALVINFLRSRTITQLSQELAEAELLADDCCGGHCARYSDEDWADVDSFDELDEMVEEVIAKSEAAKAESNKDTKTSKKSTSKKTATKSISKKK